MGVEAGEGYILKPLQVFLLRRFRVYSNDQELKGLEGRKVQELFCYLVFHRNHPLSREHLASLLWNGNSEARARGYLRKALWHLQTAFGGADVSVRDDHLLKADSECIKLTPRKTLWLDIDVFEKAYESVKSISGKNLDATQVATLERAQSLYEGELLEGWDQDWCLCERERFHYIYLAMMDKLVDYFETSHSYEHGIEHALRILHFDRVHERTYQKLMRLYYLAGDRTSALREYERCAEVLIDELGVQPGPRIKALYQQVLTGALDNGRSLEERPRETAPVVDLMNIVESLHQLQEAMGDLQGKVQREISLLENVLTGNSH